MRTIIVPLALAAAGLTATGAVAQTQPTTTAPAQAPTPAAPAAGSHGRHGSPLMRADTNHDGVVTKDEVLAQSDAMYAKMAANRGAATGADDGKKAMTKEAVRARATAMFDRADTNHDGKLDAAEIAARDSMMGGHKGGMGKKKRDTAAAAPNTMSE